MHSVSGDRVAIIWHKAHLRREGGERLRYNASRAEKSSYTNTPWIRLRRHKRGNPGFGLCGSQTYKPYVVMGPAVDLGPLLLRMNSLHGTKTLVDEATSWCLDAHAFRTRPLEVIAVDRAAPHTVAYSLTLASQQLARDGLYSKWQQVFDTYRSGDAEGSRKALQEWSAVFGADKTSERLQTLLTESPPRFCTVQYDVSGCVDDALL